MLGIELVAVHRVISRAAIEGIDLAVAALESVLAEVSEELILACASGEMVVAGAPVNHVVAGASDEHQIVPQLAVGEPMTGVWFNRTQEYAARRRGEDFDRMKYATPEVLTFDPLPCWAHLSEERQRQRVAEVIERIDAAATARIAATGITPPGPAVVRNQRPHDPTNRPKRSPAPLFHCATKAMRQEMWDAYAWFVGAYRQAAEKLKLGDRTAAFPPECFPPAMPFVSA